MSEVATMERARARTREGLVVSNKMDKTAVVSVARRVRHGKYHKTLVLHSKYMVHDERNECEVGDRVLIVESRPLSRHKRWRLRRVLEKAVKAIEIIDEPTGQSDANEPERA